MDEIYKWIESNCHVLKCQLPPPKGMGLRGLNKMKDILVN